MYPKELNVKMCGLVATPYKQRVDSLVLTYNLRLHKFASATQGQIVEYKVKVGGDYDMPAVWSAAIISNRLFFFPTF